MVADYLEASRALRDFTVPIALIYTNYDSQKPLRPSRYIPLDRQCLVCLALDLSEQAGASGMFAMWSCHDAETTGCGCACAAFWHGEFRSFCISDAPFSARATSWLSEGRRRSRGCSSRNQSIP